VFIINDAGVFLDTKTKLGVTFVHYIVLFVMCEFVVNDIHCIGELWRRRNSNDSVFRPAGAYFYGVYVAYSVLTIGECPSLFYSIFFVIGNISL